jgi:glycosyltransferase involved in cell wall biosynthesis
VTGRLVPIGDATALADTLTAVLSDPESAARMGAAGAGRVAAVLDRDNLIDEVVAVYHQVLRRT